MAAWWFWRISNLGGKEILGGQCGSQPATAYWASGAHELSLGMSMKQGGLKAAVPV